MLRPNWAALVFVIATSALQEVHAEELANQDCITFDQEPIGRTYDVNDKLEFSATNVTFRSFTWSNNVAYNRGYANIADQRFVPNGSGRSMWTNNINLHIEFPHDIHRLTLKYGSWGGNINFAVNGDETNLGGRSLKDLQSGEFDGTSVRVSEDCDNSKCVGELTIVGDQMRTLLIGGQEFGIDNICTQFDTVARIDEALETLDTLVVDDNMKRLIDQLIALREAERARSNVSSEGNPSETPAVGSE